MAVSLGTLVTAGKLAREGFRMWRQKRRRKKAEKRELTSEHIEIETTEGSGMRKYRKLVVVVVGAVLTLAARWVPMLEDADAAALVDAVILGGTAIGVWAAPNDS